MSYKLTKNQIKNIIKKGSLALFQYCLDNDIHYVVTGASGGLDSSVILGFAYEACRIAEKQGFKLNSIGLIMPCESSPQSIKLGRKAIEKFSAKEIYIDLSSVFAYATANTLVPGIDKQIKKILEETKGAKALDSWSKSQKIAQGNIKARLRMMFGTYHVARMSRGIVLSTDNLSEFWMAFWTICGDVGDFGIIQKVLKGIELYDIAEYLGVPNEILKAKPDDGLGIGGGDEDQLGAAYPLLDRIMIKLIQKGFDPDGPREQLKNLPNIEGVPAKTVMSLAKRSINGSFKRKGAIVLERTELGLSPIEEIDV